MKKLVLFAITGFYVLNVKSQITITSSNMPGSNDTIRYSNASLTSVGNFVTTGGNHSWDFSTLQPTSQDIRAFKPSISTPYAFYFLPPKYGEKTQDSVGVSTFKFKNIYTFYKKNSGAFSGEGVGFSYNGVPLAGNYYDNDELYNFPLDYLDRDSTTFKFKVNLPTVGFYGKQGYRITEVDGWGTVTTPYGTANCLRLITTQYSTDSIGTSIGDFSFPNYSRSYQWVTTTEKIPFLEVSGQMNGSVFVPAQVKYRDVARSLVNVKEEGAILAISVFPNPSTNELSVITNPNDGRILAELSDLHGKVLKSQVLEQTSAALNQHRIDVSEFAKGFYLLNLSNTFGNQVLKIFIQ